MPYTVTTANVTDGSPEVGLSGIAKKLGLCARYATTPMPGAPSGWGPCLAAAKALADLNGMGWDGPPYWGTTPKLRVGQVIKLFDDAPSAPPGAPPAAAAKGGFPLWLLGLGLAGFALVKMKK